MFKPITMTAGLILLASLASATELQDPMAPFNITLGSNAKSARAEFVLSAIIISNQRRVAIINDRAYQLGHRVGTYELTSIEPNRVQMTSDVASRTLVLNTKPTENSDDPS